jgi:predicted RNase H-like HicB family nuclease
VRLRYHHESEGWWADSPDVPGFSAAGRTLAEVRSLAIEGVEFACGEPVAIVEEGSGVARDHEGYD